MAMLVVAGRILELLIFETCEAALAPLPFGAGDRISRIPELVLADPCA